MRIPSSPRAAALLGATALLTSAARADIVWTGQVDDNIFNAANWDLTNSTVTTIANNVTIEDNVVIRNAPAPVVIPDLFGQVRFEIGEGFTMTVDNSTVRAAGNDGIGSVTAAVLGITIDVVNGGALEPFFVVNEVRVEIDGTSSATFGGPANPINLSTVNLTSGAALNLTMETPAEFIAEHLQKVFVDDQPAIVGQNIDVAPVGALGCSVTVIVSSIGTNYCTATPNSTGSSGSIGAVGSVSIAGNDVTLEATGMPPGQFGIFVTSMTQDFVPNVGSGNLCLGGAIGRYQNPGQIVQVSPGGSFSLAIDLQFVPQGAGLVAVQPGQTWNFQAWHRDFSPAGGNTSNLTNGLSIAFQ